MNVPDYISPIIGYRMWQWDSAGLKSLNCEPWLPGRPLSARCRSTMRRCRAFAQKAADDSHNVPEQDCTCGVYAAKSLEHLRETGYTTFGVYGEVHLWGRVVEHELGWRAQFAYPKALFLPPDMLPFTLAAMQSWLQTLTAYGVDVFIADPKENIRLWVKDSGCDAAGLNYLVEKSKAYYVRCRERRAVTKGDRVAILGGGIAVVERVNDEDVHAVLWKRRVLRIGRKELVWDERNMRWEATKSVFAGCAKADEVGRTKIQEA